MPSYPPNGPAGGSLTGTYPNPTIKEGAVTDANVAAANKDGAREVPSMRTLGSGANQACAGNDARLLNSRPPIGLAGGDLVGQYPNPVLAAEVVTAAKIAAANKDGLPNVPSLRTLGRGANQAAAGNDPRLDNARLPTGNALGDLTGAYPAPVIAKLQGYTLDLITAAPTPNQVLGFVGGKIVPVTQSGGGGGGGTISSITLDFGVTGLLANTTASSTLTSDGTFAVTGTLGVGYGGTGAASLTANGVLVGGTTVSATAAGTNGQLLVGQTSAKPQFKSVTGAISITSEGVTAYVGTLGVDKGGTGLSSPAVNAVILGNGASGLTTAALGTNGQLLVGQTSGAPAFKSLSGAISVDKDGVTAYVGSVGVGQGGTGQSSFTQYGVVLGNAGNALGVTAAGTAGQILVGQGAANPSFQTMGGDATLSSTAQLTIAKLGGNSISLGTLGALDAGKTFFWNGTAIVPASTLGGGLSGGLTLYCNKAATSPYVLSTQFDEDTGWDSGAVVVANDLNGTVIAEFITAVDAVFEAIPAGLWAGNVYAESATATAGTDTAIRIKVAVRNGATTTVIGTSDYVYLATYGAKTAYSCNAYVPATNLSAGDRIVFIIEGRRFAPTTQSVKASFGKTAISHVNSTLNAPGGTGVLKVVNGNLQFPAAKVSGADFASAGAFNVFAGPSSGSTPAEAGFRTLVAGDIPDLAASKITTGGIAIARGGTGYDGSGSGLAINLVFASPASGSAGAPSFRALDVADLPVVSRAKGGTEVNNTTIAKNVIFAGPVAAAAGTTGNATFRSLEVADLPTVSLAKGGTNTDNSSVAKKTVFIGPKDSESTPGNASFRVLEEADLPSLGASKIGSGGLAIARGGTGYDGGSSGTTPAINLVFASTSSGTAGAPSFRALVVADLPTSGLTAGGVLYRTNPLAGTTAAITATAAGTANQYLASGGSAAGNAPTWADIPNDIMGQYPSKPSTATASAVIMDVIAKRAWTLVQANSGFRCKVAATGSAVTLVLKRKRAGVADATITTVTFATSSLSGSPSTFANTDVAIDDILTLEVTGADSNNVMENIYWTIGGKL